MNKRWETMSEKQVSHAFRNIRGPAIVLILTSSLVTWAAEEIPIASGSRQSQLVPSPGSETPGHGETQRDVFGPRSRDESTAVRV